MDAVVIVWLLVIGSAIWVAIDASNLGVKRGCLGGGVLDMGVAGWFFSLLLIWIVGFPAYLAQRSKYVARARLKNQPPEAEQQSSVKLPRLPLSDGGGAPKKYCTSCGHPLAEGTHFCGSCGAKLGA